MNKLEKTIPILTIMFMVSGSAEASDFVAKNYSYNTICAEEDNINVAFRSYSDKQSNFEIKATHPNYIDLIDPASDNCDADFTGCSTSSIFTLSSLQATDLSCEKIYDDGINVFLVCTEPNWWRPYFMTVSVNDKSYQAHRLVLNKKVVNADSWPEALVFYQDGYLRIKPHPPQGWLDVCFGSSVVVGPVNSETSKRPYVDISTIEIEPKIPCLKVYYRSGEKSHICLSVNRSEALVGVRPEYKASKPLASFRSMWVTDGNADVDYMAWKNHLLPSFDDTNIPISEVMSCKGCQLDRDWWHFYRQNLSRHNTSASDITLSFSVWPDIKANRSDGPIILPNNDTLSITVQLTAGDSIGNNADWWVLAATPWGHWYYYTYPNQWTDPGLDLNNIFPAYQGPLLTLEPLEVLAMTGLPSGDYVLYFGVDTEMNGLLDFDKLYYDAVEVKVQ